MTEFYVIDCPNCGRVTTPTTVNPDNRADRCRCHICGGVGITVYKTPDKIRELKEDLAVPEFQSADKMRKK